MHRVSNRVSTARAGLSVSHLANIFLFVVPAEVAIWSELAAHSSSS